MFADEIFMIAPRLLVRPRARRIYAPTAYQMLQLNYKRHRLIGKKKFEKADF